MGAPYINTDEKKLNPNPVGRGGSGATSSTSCIQSIGEFEAHAVTHPNHMSFEFHGREGFNLNLGWLGGGGGAVSKGAERV